MIFIDYDTGKKIRISPGVNAKIINRDGSDRKRFLPEITGKAKFIDRINASKSHL